MVSLQPFLSRTSVAYFSMEIALRPEMHTYSGGLGILAGDSARSAADLGLPIVFVTLASHRGYLRQDIEADGTQIDNADPWKIRDFATPLDAMVAVEIEGRSVWIRPWLHTVSSPLGAAVPVLLLDTDFDQNAAVDREITDRLYGGDEIYRLKQEIVLGIGGAKALEALGFRIATFHLNEGHAALLTLHLLRKPALSDVPDRDPVERVREACVFTTHTPVEAGHDRFSYADIERVLGTELIDLDELKLLGGTSQLNLTLLALNLSGYVNGVALRHAETTRRMFPGYRIESVTNGVHVSTWTHPAFADLYQTDLACWAHEPERLVRCDQLPDDQIWAAHQRAKAELLALVFRETGHNLDPDRPTIAFARRMTGYKRPDLIFTELERLRAIGRRYPFQIVMAGKAHPRDSQGKALIAQIHRHMRELSNDVPVIFLSNYDMQRARALVAGADIWLNTPMPPLEASGTSGMKAALNGVLNLSVVDGWWVEACIEGVTGWGIDGRRLDMAQDDAAELYGKLEDTVLPLYYENRPRWIWMMKQAMSKIGPYFNSQRMMRRYASEAYLR
jgi:starch phosphorylase